MDLTEVQWQVLKPLLTPQRRPDGRGRPWRDARAVLNGILWVLRTGAPWHDLPDRYPPYQTCHRRFQQWQRDGTLTRLLHALAEDLRARGKLDLSETFIDASFSSAKKGALLSARLAAEKAVKSWRSQGFLVANDTTASAGTRHRVGPDAKPYVPTSPMRHLGILWRRERGVLLGYEATAASGNRGRERTRRLHDGFRRLPVS